MERTDHILLVGPDALEFAKKLGFKEEKLLTEKARKKWLKWKESLSDKDDWGPTEHMKKRIKVGAYQSGFNEVEYHHGTTNVLAIDSGGNIAGITSTSGLSYKIPGRVGDSPIIGAGLYVDNEIGAAGATGKGEDAIKTCASFYIVSRMREGRTPQQACEDTIRMIADKYRKIHSDFLPDEKFVAVNKKGEFACAGMRESEPIRMAVMNKDGYRLQDGPLLFPLKAE
jgi:N4-(beta-N-acetylglucosaminyl)-L-asparaginase